MSAALAAAATVAAAALAAADTAIQPDWMTQDAEQKVVTLKIIGSMDHANGTMNFNGYGNGEMTVTVPFGWLVKVDFSNGGFGALPHSLAIIDPRKRPKLQGGDPAFPAATTIKLVQGLVPGETDNFEFTADKAGRFLFWCGVPSHGQNGMWTNLVISKSAKAAQVTVKGKDKRPPAPGGRHGRPALRRPVFQAQKAESAPEPLAALAALALGTTPPPPFLAMNGHDWAALGEQEKLALLRGFLIGAAYAEKGRGKAVSPEALEALRQEGQLRFVFVPELYKARLEDFYFYRDQRRLPLYEALRRIEAQIRTDNRPPPDPGSAMPGPGSETR
ncbi:MAG TPA: sulfocyanin-like copper-binding protein [Myxococcales bacterium]|nr:sulfocyanin-like copper-binding protein [Myxococcales bacterium]